MKIKIYQVDAFTDKIFSGNSAAICPLETWLADEILQSIAMENNLAETGFYVKKNDYYEIRWFTPTIEVDLCGHATLAAGHILVNHENYSGDSIKFISHRSGELKVYKQGDFLTLDFPVDVYSPVELTESLTGGFSLKPVEAYFGKSDYMLVYEHEDNIRELVVDLNLVAKLDNSRGVIVTAPGDEVDFVSRFFAPQSGIDEDPVTGSSHTTMIPYWAGKLNKVELTAMQLSKRVGHLKCKFMGDRVQISGKAKTYMIGEIIIE